MPKDVKVTETNLIQSKTAGLLLGKKSKMQILIEFSLEWSDFTRPSSFVSLLTRFTKGFGPPNGRKRVATARDSQINSPLERFG